MILVDIHTEIIYIVWNQVGGPNQRISPICHQVDDEVYCQVQEKTGEIAEILAQHFTQ